MGENRQERVFAKSAVIQNKDKAKEPGIIDMVKVVKNDGSVVFEAKPETIQPLVRLKAVTYDSRARIKKVDIPSGGKIDKAA